MRVTRVIPVLLCLALSMVAVSFSRVALAEDTPGLSDVLSELLKGAESDNPTPGPDRRVPFGQQELQLSYAPLVKHTGPAVVNVYASQTARQTRSPFAGDPFFEQFFGRSRPRVQNSLGSGVLVDSSGIVVTNYHVIANADEIKVATSDGREFTSAVLLKDESLDLAILKIESPETFPVIAIGDSEALQVGDLVLAIGNPFGVGQTTTSGIISALARSSRMGASDTGYFIQTDAAINPGNSGGALINMSGQLVGINTAIFSKSGGSIGIGFAIPSNLVRAVVEAAKNGSDFFERPYIGASFEEVTPAIAESLGMARPTGALVSAVTAESPAAKAGLKPGDVIMAFNTAPVEQVEGLGYRIAIAPIGSTVELSVLSGGEEKQMPIELIRAPEGSTAESVTIRGRSPFAGASVAELSPRLAQRLGMNPNNKGVTIIDVDGDSPADSVGLKAKDIVREINGEAIDTPEKLAAVAEQQTRVWRFSIERDGRLLRQTLRF